MSLMTKAHLVVVLLGIAACDGGPRPGLDGGVGGDLGVSTALVGPAGGTFMLLGGRIKLEVPPGALSSDVLVTARKSTNHPSSSLLVDNTAFELLPAGAVFQKAVTLSIAYQEADLPKGSLAAGLTMNVVAGGDWWPVKGGGVKPEAKLVWAKIKGTGTYGVMANASSGLDGGVTTDGATVADGGPADAPDGPAPGDGGAADVSDGPAPDMPLDAAPADAPAADMPSSDAPAPDAPAPDVSQPDLMMPDAGGPDLLQPDAAMPDGSLLPPATGCLSGDGVCPFACSPTQDSDCAPVALGAGSHQSCYVAASGGVLCWGNNKWNSSGILGIGTVGGEWPRPIPTLMKIGVKQVAPGYYRTYALTKAGAVWYWNDTPKPVPGLSSGVKAISANYNYRCAISDAGEALCWGGNFNGQLGTGDKTYHAKPNPVLGLSYGVTTIATGRNHACALQAGVVKCWGTNIYMQLGLPASTTESFVPSPAKGIGSGVTSLATGNGFTCVVQGGVGKCWGHHLYQGAGASAPSSVAAPVKGSLAGVQLASVHGRQGTVCALTKTKELHCWGQNMYGQVGDGTTTDCALPKLIMKGVDEVAVGELHTCARSGHQIHCWGKGAKGQLGNGKLDFEPRPVAPAALKGMKQVGLGSYHGCGLTSVGGVKCWGTNHYGQLGTGDLKSSLIPRNAKVLTSSVTGLAVGHWHTCAVHAGSVKCWGGKVNKAPITTAKVVSGFAGAVSKLAASRERSCAVAGGLMSCWNSDKFTANKGATKASDVALGWSSDSAPYGDHTCNITSPIGQVLCWGSNGAGQRGTGGASGSAVVGMYYSATYVWAGYQRSCAMRGGRLYCWGAKYLGDGKDTGSNKPVEVKLPAPPPGVSHAAMGKEHTCAIRANALYCWGRNDRGQLGDGTQKDRTTPTIVSGMTSHVSSVTAGPHSTCVVHKGIVKCWGDNKSGQLGLGYSDSWPSPQKVVWPAKELCKIDGKYYHKGEQATGGCAICDPNTNLTAWTVSGNACVVKGVCCKSGAVSPDKCGTCDPTKDKTGWSPTPGLCKINGVCHAKGAKHSGGCAECDPSVSAASWTVKGSACLIDNTCKTTGAMNSATCGSCAPTKNRYGWTMNHCRIDGSCVAHGKKNTGGCAECDVSTSTTSWTVNGNACLIHGVCQKAGDKLAAICSSCEPSKDKYAWTLAPGKCLIGGACVSKGALHPGKCAVCEPATSTSSWTVKGSACLVGDTCRKAGDKGPGGCTSCQPGVNKHAYTLLSGHCTIDGACHKSGDKHTQGCGTCNPSISTSYWTPAGNNCVIDGNCRKDGDKQAGCGVCDTAASKTQWTVSGDKCLIGSQCMGNGAKEPGGCGVCDPTSSKTSWSLPKGCKATHAWSRTMASFYEAHDVAVDSKGNVYVAGNYDTRAFLTSYTPSGVVRWRIRSTPVGYGIAVGLDVAVDGEDNIYLAGTFTKVINFGGSTLSCAGPDLFLASFDASGKHRWSKRPAFGQIGQKPAMAVDHKGNIFLTGSFTSKIYFDKVWLQKVGKNFVDVFVVSYDANGKHRWSNSFGNTHADVGTAVAVDRAGNSYFGGYYEDSIDFGGGALISNGKKPSSPNAYLVSFDAKGAHRWSRSFGAAWGYVYGVATDASANVYITGFLSGPESFGGTTSISSGAFLVGFTGYGAHRWTRSFAAKTGRRVATDGQGNVYLSGDLYGSADFGGGTLSANDGLFIASYSPGGLYRWSRAHSRVGIRGLSVDGPGNVVAAAQLLSSTDLGGGQLHKSSYNNVKSALLKLTP